MYQRILLPLDGSPVAEQILPHLAVLARNAGQQALLLRVVEPPDEAHLTEHQAYFEQWRETEKARAAAYLDKVAGGLASTGITASCVVAVGKAADEVISCAETYQPDLIAMTTHGQTGSARGLTRWAMGSVTDRIVSYTKNPLLVVRAKDDAPVTPVAVPLRSVIVPLDGSSFAESALPHATTLADELDLEVILVRVVPDLDPGAPPSVRQAITDEANSYLTEVSQRMRRGTRRVRPVLRVGSPAHEIVELARETPDDWVVMASHGRSGLGRWVLGSVASRVLQTCGEPVLLVHPAGSPA